jgi:pimeloyl-ACP methyl ester carboxylesterase
VIGHEKVGSGAIAVMILNDWMCDTSTWDGARAYLDRDRFTWAFADLRGYGRSMSRGGKFTVEEAAADVITLADSLGWSRFAIVGHSMSSLVALHLAQHLPDRIERAVVLTPPPPTGFGADDATLGYLRAMARGDDSMRMNYLRAMWGERLSERWIGFKVARWRACADPEAVEGYAAMFARLGLPDPTASIAIPLLAVTGEQDAEIMRRDAVTNFLTPLCERLVVTPLADCGHYPMQEAPPLLVTILERFLTGDTASGGA